MTKPGTLLVTLVLGFIIGCLAGASWEIRKDAIASVPATSGNRLDSDALPRECMSIRDGIMELCTNLIREWNSLDPGSREYAFTHGLFGGYGPCYSRLMGENPGGRIGVLVCGKDGKWARDNK